MKHPGTVRMLVVAAILLAGMQGTAQTTIGYRCRRPLTGSPAVAYRWYICWPDSNLVVLQTTTNDTFANVVHLRNGERVRVAAVDADSRVGPRSVASIAWSLIIPTDALTESAPRLHPTHPNPFNSRTTVVFSLPEAQRARVAIYSLNGRLVDVLADAQLPAGEHAQVWAGFDSNGQAVGSGVYICRLETAGKAQSVRMTLVR